MPDRKCSTCKIIKDRRLFYKYSLCNKCKITNEVSLYLLNAKLANHFNTSIEEINYILEIDFNDPNKEGGEHSKYDDVMLKLCSYTNSSFNNTELITRYLDE